MINNLKQLYAHKAIVDGPSLLARDDLQSAWEAVKQSLGSQSDEVRIAALLEALKCGQPCKHWIFEIVKTETGPVQWVAFDLLWEDATDRGRKQLLKYWPLRSQAGVDYTKLRHLLATEQWEEADAETKELMLTVAGREKEGLLDRKSGETFPCADLCTIDQLWVKYSRGRFGFSVQKRILESLDKNQKVNTKTSGSHQLDSSVKDSLNQVSDSLAYGEPHLRDIFASRVGWQVDGKWLYSHELIFNLSAPQGHLPSPRIATPSDLRGGGEQACREILGRWCRACCFGSVRCGVLFFGWWSILDRLNNCPCKLPLRHN